MKNLLYLQILILLLMANKVNSQKKQLDSLSYSQSQDITFFKKVKNNTKIFNYTTASSNLLKVGDTLTLGNPTSQEVSTRTNTGGVGSNYRASRSSSRSSVNKTYDYVLLGKPAGFGSILMAMSGEAPLMAGVNLKNTKVIVKEMRVRHKGSKKKPLNLILILGELNGRAFGLNKYLSVLDTELALESGEIILGNVKMTRGEAIAKLKESKELFELDVMSKEEYDKIRKELIPIIKNN